MEGKVNFIFKLVKGQLFKRSPKMRSKKISQLISTNLFTIEPCPHGKIIQCYLIKPSKHPC